MIICVDFDGTCVTHEFPHIGKEIGAPLVLRRLTEAGHKLILFTMRSNHDKAPVVHEKDADHLKSDVPPGNYLDDAVNWFKQHDIPLYGIQTNPTQHSWTSSPKAYGQLYIDDAALGIPLVNQPNKRPYVNWVEVLKLLQERGIL